MPDKIYLALPTYDGFVHVGLIEAAQNCLLPEDDGQVRIAFRCSSLLAFMFNECWCEARNARAQGFTHFAMLHGDVWPDQAGWLSILRSELTVHDADVVSAIVALKDNRGVTSTAWHPSDTPFDNALVEQIKIADLAGLPTTFDADAAGKPGHYLLGNTGCFICDLRKPWVDDVDFDVQSWTIPTLHPDGRVTHVPKVLSEDWKFSRDVADRGGRVMATQTVTVAHVGAQFYRTCKQP